jgi:5'-methylthioadenosine phosphorylase
MVNSKVSGMSKGLVGLLGGTGLGDALAKQMTDTETHTVDTPFGRPSAPILVGRLGRREVAFLNRHGPGHRLNPSRVPYAANLFALKKLGVRTILASAAVGSLRKTIAPGHLVAVDQFIDKTFRRQGSFFDDYGAVHGEMADPVCHRVHDAVIKTSRLAKLKTHAKGTYVCMEGPQFSTRAESLMHRTWGGDLIGMTALPEARLAREAQVCYALIALVSDYDCWQVHAEGMGKRTLLAEILGNLKRATDNALRLIEAVLASDAGLVDEACPCRHSLDLAVWTEADAIDPRQRKKLRVLFQ